MKKPSLNPMHIANGIARMVDKSAKKKSIKPHAEPDADELDPMADDNDADNAKPLKKLKLSPKK